MPAFASESFTSWFARRPKGRGGSRVLLWPDTFNNYFHPAVAKAAVGVLEDAGFKIVLPQRDPCCGRPLYDYGMLETARRWLRHVLSSLGEENEAGTPMVGLEPSCTAVFRDELIELFPHDETARRLQKQTFTLAEFLASYAPDYQVPNYTARRSSTVIAITIIACRIPVVAAWPARLDLRPTIITFRSRAASAFFSQRCAKRAKTRLLSPMVSAVALKSRRRRLVGRFIPPKC